MTALDVVIVTGCAMGVLVVLLYVGLVFGPVAWVLETRVRAQQRAFDQRLIDHAARVAAYRRPQPAKIADVRGAEYEPPPVTKPALTPAELELKEAFRIVGLSETASEENIRAHRKNQLGHFHPDKHPEGKERRGAEREFKRLNAGFQTIYKHKGWA